MNIKNKTMILENIKNKIKTQPFNFAVVLCLLILFAILAFRETNSPAPKTNKLNTSQLMVFVQDGCPRCAEAEKFLDSIKSDYPNVKFKFYNLKKNKSVNLLIQNANKFKIPYDQLGTPIFVASDKYILGFDDENTEDVVELISNMKTEENEVDLAIFGKHNVLETSIPFLAMIMGILDGFSPFILLFIFYITSVPSLSKNKKKMAFFGGIFVLSSILLLFLFMTAWLNVFIYFNFLNILSLSVGIIAIYFGIMSLHKCVKNVPEKPGKLEVEEKNFLKKLFSSDVSLYSIFLVIFLAFMVNTIDFLGSTGFNTTFTYILSQANLSGFMYYFYILLYTIFSVLDYAIVFVLALFASHKYIGSKYEKYFLIISGIVMLIMGIYMVFFPNFLR